MVRYANYKDLNEIYELIEPYHSESVNALTEIPYDKGVVYEFLHYNMDSILVYERDYKIVGILIFACMPTWWADDYYFSDILFYVKPEYRNGMAGGRLIKSLQAIARVEGKVVQLAGLNGTSGVNNDYNKRFTNIGSVFLTKG